jgi:hypothetical protein
MTAPASAFESLPRELRNMVYHELWKFTPQIKTRRNGVDMQLLLRSQATDQSSAWETSGACSFPAWLRTCKTTLLEGLEELQHLSSWTVGPVHIEKSPTPDLLCWGAGILNPTAAGKLTIWAEGLECNTEYRERAMFALNKSDMEYVDGLALHFNMARTICTLRLRTELQLCCRRCFRRYEEMGWSLDLSCFERHVTRLEVFELELRFFMIPFSEPATDWSTCRSSFSAEVERVGRLWVGDEGALSTNVSPEPNGLYEIVLYTFRAAGDERVRTDSKSRDPVA